MLLYILIGAAVTLYFVCKVLCWLAIINLLQKILKLTKQIKFFLDDDDDDDDDDFDPTHNPRMPLHTDN